MLGRCFAFSTWRKDREGRSPGGDLDGTENLILICGRVEKEDFGAFFDVQLYPGKGLDDVIIAAATECTSEADIEAYADALAKVLA